MLVAQKCQLLLQNTTPDTTVSCDDIDLFEDPTSIAFYVELLRVIFGSMFILYLPGYWVSRCFFRETEIDILERIALSFALAISVIPLLSFYLNLIGMKISTWNVFITATLVTCASVAYIHFFQEKKK